MHKAWWVSAGWRATTTGATGALDIFRCCKVDPISFYEGCTHGAMPYYFSPCKRTIPTGTQIHCSFQKEEWILLPLCMGHFPCTFCLYVFSMLLTWPIFYHLYHCGACIGRRWIFGGRDYTASPGLQTGNEREWVSKWSVHTTSTCTTSWHMDRAGIHPVEGRSSFAGDSH